MSLNDKLLYKSNEIESMKLIGLTVKQMQSWQVKKYAINMSVSHLTICNVSQQQKEFGPDVLLISYQISSAMHC